MLQFLKRGRKFRNLLIDSRFQLKYTLAVVVISASLATVLGWFLYQSQQELLEANRENSELVALEDPTLNEALKAELAATDRAIAEQNTRLFRVLFFSLGGLVLALTLLGIFATHKIAGPAYAMRRFLSEIADGHYPHVRNLRKGDELGAVVEELKRMVDSLRSRELHELNALLSILAVLRDAGLAPDLVSEAEQIVADKQTRLALTPSA